MTAIAAAVCALALALGAITATDPSPAPDPGASSVLRGVATWYAAPAGTAAAGPALRRFLGAGWRGSAVDVCHLSECVRVRLTDWCACSGERIIDLNVGAFAQLAPLRRGVIRVRLALGAPPGTRDHATADGYWGLMDGLDAVTNDVALAVIRRDDGCVAVTLGEPPSACGGRLTLDHVRDKPLVGDPIVKRGAIRRHRYRAPSDTAHLVALCERHHLDGWATSHRPELRDYLLLKEAEWSEPS